MAKKNTPAEAKDKAEKSGVTVDAVKHQIVTDDQKKALEERTAKTNELGELIGGKIGPMLTGVIKRKEKTGKVVTNPSSTKGEKNSGPEAAVSTEDTSVVKEMSMTADSGTEATTSASTDEPATKATKDEGGFSLFGLQFDWGKMEKDPFAELAKFFEEETRKDVKDVVKSEPAEGSMVIVADFTLPYRCRENYVCEDMCYTDDELADLPIPPFAKDDFAVTRKNSNVDIYPDLNDSHLFKNFIVVKEIEGELEFKTGAGGTVKGDKSGAHPRFIYSPPPDKSGVSDSFIYTLYNTKNKLSDTATVWIEVGQVIPTFSMSPTTVCRNAGEQPITVNPNGNELSAIEVNGRGITKIMNTATGVKTWTFNPKGPGVVIGSNIITLTLHAREVGSIDVTVTEILAAFAGQGELELPEGDTKSGMIVLHDASLNVNNYSWEWNIIPDGSLNISADRPSGDGSISLPLLNVPPGKNDFMVHVKLMVTSAIGCIDRKEADVKIVRPKVEPGTPEIISVLNEICTNAKPVPISVDPKGNGWTDIALDGPGIIKTIDASSVPSWKFNPKDEKVITGINKLTLTLKGKKVDTLNVTVVESIADFETSGIAQFRNQGKPGGVVLIQDRSVNATNYNWKWTSKYGSGKQDISPDADGIVKLPFLHLPLAAEGFELTLTLAIISEHSCENIKTSNVEISIERESKSREIHIVKKYLVDANLFISQPKELRKIGISQSAIDKMEDEVNKALEHVNDPVLTEKIKDESFDPSISNLAVAMETLTNEASPENFVSNTEYMSLLNSLTMASFGLLSMRSNDLTNNPKMVSAEKITKGTIDKMVESGYRVNAQTKNDFGALLETVDASKIELRQSYEKRNEFYNK